MFGRVSHAGHPHHPREHAHPLRRRIGLTIVAALLLAAMALLIAPPHAHANFVYWSNDTASTIGRAKINGAGTNDNFISSVPNPGGVAVDSKYVYWTEGSGSSSAIGRANLDGTGVRHDFITSGVVNSAGLAVTANGIYWSNEAAMGVTTIGHANIDGSAPTQNLIDTGPVTICGLAADQSFVYYLDVTSPAIGRAPLGGGSAQGNFVPLSSAQCGAAVDSSFLYWATGDNHVGRVPVGGGAPAPGFITNAAGATQSVSGVAVNPQYVFWGNNSGATTGNFVGRANLNGGNPNPRLVPGASHPLLLAAAPSNKITINSITRKKKKGTAVIHAKVPGPGQVTLNQNSSPPDVNATTASVKQAGLTLAGASTFKIPVKPKGKTAKKLKKQVKKKGTGKVKVKVFVHFVPAGVAGVPNTQRLTVKLIKKRKR